MPSDTIAKKAKAPTQEEPPVFKPLRLSAPEVFEMSREAWERPIAREGNMSRLDYKGPGFRRWVLRLEVERMVQEGCNYINIDGGLVAKKYVQERVKKKVAEYGRKWKELAEEHTLIEIARELASLFPAVKKPEAVNGNGVNGHAKGSNGNGRNDKEGVWVRYYIYPSPPFDGPYGEKIAQMVQDVRAQDFHIDDIRVEKPGGKRRKVKGIGKHWVIVPSKTRLPTKFHSGFAEREIEAREDRTTQSYPDLYVVGTSASSLHVPDGIRKRPYITVGASHRLEEETVGAENQEAITIVHYPSVGERLVQVWSFKDLIASERKYITGIKDGATDLHRRIVELIKEEGDQSIGELADELGVDRATVEQEIKFLLEPRSLPRKTWPGLWYNKAGQRYNFHLDWIQDRLMVPFPKDDWQEDTALIFGCLHAGYATTDYPFIVREFPEIILRRNVKVVYLVGDVRAGLHHDFAHTGEVIGGLNNSAQSRFAAELTATFMTKAFHARIEERLRAIDTRRLTQEALAGFIEDALVGLVVIPGNHDLWVVAEGNDPLTEFYSMLRELLNEHILAFLIQRGLPAVNVAGIVKRKVTGYADYYAVHTLPSGLCVELQHPHLGRTETTSIRIQKAIKMSNCQMMFIANFHAAIVDHVWYPDRGQCIGVQAGCMQGLFGTRFERRVGKGRVDFGPIFLRTLSRNGRIWMTETGFYNQSTLMEPYPASIDMQRLKHELGLLGYE